MKKIYQLMLMVVILSSATIQMTAQVNGSADYPVKTTPEKPIYYYIESAADGSVVLKYGEPNNYLGHLLYAPNGEHGVQLKHDLKGTITGASISLDNALWQIVTEGGVTKLKNKGTGLVLADCRYGMLDNPSDFVAEQLSVPTQYRLRNTNQKSPSVAWYTSSRGNYIERWGSDKANSQVAWFFIVEPGSMDNYNELLKPALMADLLVSINKANALLTGTISDAIVYTDENKAPLTSKIAQAQGVYDNAESTTEQLFDVKNTLEQAMADFKATAVVNPEQLLSTNADNYKWYRIRSTSTEAYVANKVISAGTRAVGEKFTFEDKTEEPTDKQLFRVELTEDKTKVKNLINKAANTYMAADGSISETAIAGNDFTLEVLKDGISVRIKPTSRDEIYAYKNNSDIINQTGDAGSPSAWSFDFALEAPKVINSTPSVFDNNYVIRLNNGIITVDGAAEYDVFSITGQKMNEKAALTNGVYIVKVKEFTRKIIVK